MRLGDIAVVRSGLVLARKLSHEPTAYRYQLINLKSIDEDAYIEKNMLDVYDALEPLNPDYLTRQGDLVVRLSSPYTAVLIDEGTSGYVISSNFVVIRADRNLLIPEYLFWLLNTSEVKKDIVKNNTSNMLGAIRSQYFSEFEIPLPPLAEQEKIANLYLLARRENELLKELARAKKNYYELTIDKIQKEMRREYGR